MMAKIVQGNSFSNAVNYVLNRKEADIIATKGVRNIDKESIIRSFETQARLGNIAKPVAHISLDFSAQDREKLTNAKMIEIADEYMKKMGYGNTQVLIVRHTDRDHPHIHLIMNRIDFNGKEYRQSVCALPLTSHEEVEDIDNGTKYKWYDIRDGKYERDMCCPKRDIRRS